ncbi:hypothetical protein DPEC_G00011740 [Dallia pectoralis]|uniref:Uncharacterized protein n=1 Tax=Dallia pectoralis TaxID=75939 RepID=A0ACC2HLT0_DALPE|nr:hypothetical protein DPEC_G00011740 [Dallia pectoralis]
MAEKDNHHAVDGSDTVCRSLLNYKHTKHLGTQYSIEEFHPLPVFRQHAIEERCGFQDSLNPITSPLLETGSGHSRRFPSASNHAVMSYLRRAV